MARPLAFPVAALFLVGWFLSPFIGWWVSLPLGARVPRLTGDQRRFLGIRARKIWRYFEDLRRAGGPLAARR